MLSDKNWSKWTSFNVSFVATLWPFIGRWFLNNWWWLFVFPWPGRRKFERHEDKHGSTFDIFQLSRQWAPAADCKHVTFWHLLYVRKWHREIFIKTQNPAQFVELFDLIHSLRAIFSYLVLWSPLSQMVKTPYLVIGFTRNSISQNTKHRFSVSQSTDFSFRPISPANILVSNQQYCFLKDRQEREHVLQNRPMMIWKLADYGESQSTINQTKNDCRMVKTTIVHETPAYRAPDRRRIEVVLRRHNGDGYLGS